MVRGINILCKRKGGFFQFGLKHKHQHQFHYETLGADTLVHGSIASGGMDGTQDAGFAARLAGNARVAEGEILPLRVADGALHLFDRQSEKRIADI